MRTFGVVACLLALVSPIRSWGQEDPAFRDSKLTDAQERQAHVRRTNLEFAVWYSPKRGATAYAKLRLTRKVVRSLLAELNVTAPEATLETMFKRIEGCPVEDLAIGHCNDDVDALVAAVGALESAMGTPKGAEPSRESADLARQFLQYANAWGAKAASLQLIPVAEVVAGSTLPADIQAALKRILGTQAAKTMPMTDPSQLGLLFMNSLDLQARDQVLEEISKEMIEVVVQTYARNGLYPEALSKGELKVRTSLYAKEGTFSGITDFSTEAVVFRAENLFRFPYQLREFAYRLFAHEAAFRTGLSNAKGAEGRYEELDGFCVALIYELAGRDALDSPTIDIAAKELIREHLESLGQIKAFARVVEIVNNVDKKHGTEGLRALVGVAREGGLTLERLNEPGSVEVVIADILKK